MAVNEGEIRSIVTRLVEELRGNVENPPVSEPQRQVEGEEGCLPDLTEVELRTQYLVEEPRNPAEFLRLKEKTPARLGLGRAGPRYKTETQLRMRADHAAAQDSVFSLVEEGFAQRQGYTPVRTLCKDKDTYLTRPDLGRRFGEEAQKVIQSTLGDHPQVALVVGDGLSSAAIEANGADCMQAICQGLEARGLSHSPVLFVEFCRVGASDHIGSLTGAQVVCMLVGERPGLVTAESMSAYVTYEARIGVPESQRTVVSNIHKGGTPAVEAGAHIAELIETMLKYQASGVALKGKLAVGA
jgi:ethanolamine ammonia-lyase small subunit